METWLINDNVTSRKFETTADIVVNCESRKISVCLNLAIVWCYCAPIATI